MRRALRLLAAGAVALVPVGCDQPDAPLTAAHLAGCWGFARRDGQPTPLGRELPDTVRLDTAVYRNPDGRPHPQFPLALLTLTERIGAGRDSLRLDSMHVVPWPPGWRMYALRAWRFTAPDSLTLLYHANMSTSWEVQLRAVGDSLIGQAEQYSDYIPEQPIRIPVVAHRTHCPAPGPAAAI